jgi:predicted dehydrogenase
MIKIGVIGCGYWGPNLIRNFIQLPNAQVIYACDLDGSRLERISNLYPYVKTTKDPQVLFADSEINAVVIATPVTTHYALAMEALKSRKHVLIEKPMTLTSLDAESLIQRARKQDLVLAVDHTFEYVAAVNHLKQQMDKGELGDIYYINSSRLNLGLFQSDINVVWDLAPHDLSIANYLLGKMPISVSAEGSSHIIAGVEDVAYLKLEYPDNIMVVIHVSWLDPCKVRRTTVVGSKKMLVYDDVEPMEKIKLYDKSVECPRYYDNFGEFQFSYHYGNITIPKLDNVEPLNFVCSHFLDCIKTGTNPKTDGESGLNVVKILEAANRSLQNKGRREAI